MREIGAGRALGLAAMIGLVAGCTAPEGSGPDVAAGDEQVTLVTTAAAAPVPELPQSVTVSDDPLRELVFSSTLTARQRDLIEAEFADEIAASRGPARPTVAEFDLDADGTDELFVIIKANAWCGSGDVCNLWVYQQAGDGWRALSDGEDAASCVSILPTATNGYRDVRIHGQCALDMCTFDLRFDGALYQWDGNRDCRPLDLE
ncbi:MAG: hypothetical protein ACFCVH_21025 [Alphaproteobacteria bacterium]